MDASKPQLSARQLREIEYHRRHAQRHKGRYERVSYDILRAEARPWWNAYWAMYTILLKHPLRGSRALVAGCGFGDDAFRVSKLGAHVSAFDLSPDQLEIARDVARRERLTIDFREMPAENLAYDDEVFDYVIANDILHHVDLPAAIKEIRRVSKGGALVVGNEMYSHSCTERLRRSRIVEDYIYPRMRNFVYGDEEPYITRDERKLTEKDVKILGGHLSDLTCDYFNIISTRLLPERFTLTCKADRVLLKVLAPIAHLLGARVVFTGKVTKSEKRGHSTFPAFRPDPRR